MTAPLTKLPPGIAVWRVSWPMIALGLLKSLVFLTDSYWVGQLGDSELAAIGGSAFGWWMVFLACGLAATGAHALVAQHEGGGRRDRIASTLSQGLWVGLAITVVLAGVAYPLRGLYFDLLDFERGSDAYRFGMDYLGASLLGAGTLAALQVIDSAFRGLGHTRTALAISAGTVIANAALDPVLIHGWGPAPALGVAGAAWATALANGLGVGLAVWFLYGEGLRLAWQWPKWATVRAITSIGAPVTASGIGFSAVYVLLGRIINDFGQHEMAALGVSHRIESTAYMICVGLSVGTATMVGQHLGAGDESTALKSASAAMRMALAPMIGLGVLVAALAGPAMGVFTDDPAIIEAGVVYLRIQSFVFVFMAAESIYEGAFSGAGYTLPAFWITAIGTTARLPVAWVLAYPLGLGIVGVWIAVAGSTVLKGLAMGAWFQRGGWRERGPVLTD